MITFRQFIEADMASTPSMGSSVQQKSNDDLNVLGRELDISPEDMNKALEGTPVVSFSPINRKGKSKGSGPQIIIPNKVNNSGSVDGTLMQGNMQKLQNPNGSRGHGPELDGIHFRSIGRKDSSYTFPNVWLEPLRKQNAGGMGMQPPAPMGGGI